MEQFTFYLLLVNGLLLLPLFTGLGSRKFYEFAFQRSISLANRMGYLISINAPVREGKTSMQSGLKHLFEIILQNQVQEIVRKTKIILKRIDFNEINDYIVQCLDQGINDDYKIAQIIIDHLKERYEFKSTFFYDFISIKSYEKIIQDYIFAWYCLNVRMNYVQSKTPFYSHITGNISYEYDPSDTKINIAFSKGTYAIYDFMIELIDELPDDAGAAKYLDDPKNEDGDKDYRRKFGQIHQERNRMITTKQDVADEVKKFRKLTQSNLFITEKVSQRGTFRSTIYLIQIVVEWFTSLYDLLYVWIIRWQSQKFIEKTFRISDLIKILILAALIYSMINFTTLGLFDYSILSALGLFVSYKKRSDAFFNYHEMHHSKPNIIRWINNRVMYLDQFLFSAGYNLYKIRDYNREEDVGKRDKSYFDEYKLLIPVRYCFGTYDTHFWKMIQRELLDASKKQSNETNQFIIPKYFNTSEGGDDDEQIDFGF